MSITMTMMMPHFFSLFLSPLVLEHFVYNDAAAGAIVIYISNSNYISKLFYSSYIVYANIPYKNILTFCRRINKNVLLNINYEASYIHTYILTIYFKM